MTLDSNNKRVIMENSSSVFIAKTTWLGRVPHLTIRT